MSGGGEPAGYVWGGEAAGGPPAKRRIEIQRSTFNVQHTTFKAREGEMTHLMKAATTWMRRRLVLSVFWRCLRRGRRL